MNSLRAHQAAVKKLRLLVFTPKADVDVFREKIEETYRSLFVPNRVEATTHTYGGIPCDLLVPEVYSSHRVMLYIHGGSFVGGSCASWRSFCSTIANTASCRVVVPEFRLAPVHAFPAGLEDVQAVFRSLYTEEQIARSLDGTDSTGEKSLPEIIVAADGSGASLALALMLNLHGKYRESVRSVILLSPWLDLTPSSPLISGRKVADEVISGEALRRCGDMYTFAANLANPLVSPLKASVDQLAGFPQVYIQIGGKEILLEEAHLYKNLLEQAGVPCILDVWPGMIHLFQMADEYLSESHLAVERIGQFIKKQNVETEMSSTDGSLTLEKSLHSDA